MSDTVSWLLAMSVREGKHDDFRALMAEMIASTRQEPGALAYEWSIGDDQTTIHIHERYRDPAAVLTHMEAFGTRFRDRFLAALKPVSMTVYGHPDAAVRETLAPLRPAIMQPLDGFAR